jgi:hypothetical protein
MFGTKQLDGKKVSTDPIDYGMRRYTDLEISEHCVLIRGLPKSIPRRELEERVTKVLNLILKETDGEKQEAVVKVSVISDYNNCVKLS